MTQRLAVWSGPRNVSTALMRSFEARGDCHVVDEPLYAAFLAATGIQHPARDAILDAMPTRIDDALAALERAPDLPLQYEKHMSHHWQRGWPEAPLAQARHAFLIRDPARVIASYAKVRQAPTPSDLGLLQQEFLIDVVTALGQPVVVIDGDELRADPARMLPLLCEALGVSYTARMLSWPAGSRDTDGVWAPHWYAAVERSTGFEPPRDMAPDVPKPLEPVLDVLQPAFERLARRRLR